jgi:hypothetical protein
MVAAIPMIPAVLLLAVVEGSKRDCALCFLRGMITML